MPASSIISNYFGVGVASSRPTSLTLATGTLGLYYATDTGALSMWNGSSWQGFFPEDVQNSITVTGTATAVTATGFKSVVVHGKAAGGSTTLDINGGYVGQILRVDHIQGATAESVALGTSVAIGSVVTSFTATGTAGIRDCLVFENLDGTHWALQAVNQGFSF